ncbi:unnamed protein product [Arctogadus glacialis]
MIETEAGTNDINEQHCSCKAGAKTDRKRRPIFCQYNNDGAMSEVTDQDILLLRELIGTQSYIASKPPMDVE